MSPAHCLGMPPPGVELSRLIGQLIVIEGPDASGRSTQIAHLSKWIEQTGCSVVQVGLKRSVLVGNELEKAKQGNVLSPRTMSLFYAADFYDQMENNIVPALCAGSIVIADRYIFTLMARDLVRGADPAWVESLYSRALAPDAVYFLQVSRNSSPFARSSRARGLIIGNRAWTCRFRATGSTASTGTSASSTRFSSRCRRNTGSRSSTPTSPSTRYSTNSGSASARC